MLPQKNFSPLQLAALNSIVLSFLLGFIVFLVNPVWWIALVCSAVFFVFCFALINYTLQQFVYRKIKLIYKFIYLTKASKREEFYNKTLVRMLKNGQPNIKMRLNYYNKMKSTEKSFYKT